jgi:hypothetical protein
MILNRVTLLALLALPAIGFGQQPKLTVRVDAQRSELLFDLGPVDLPGAMPDMPDMEMSMVAPPVLSVGMPVSGYMHGFSVEIVDQEGHVLPSTLLHHINLIAPQRRELFSQIMQRVGAAGAETGPLEFPRVIGYPITRGDSLLFSVMFHNESEQSYEHVHLRLRMRFSTGSSFVPTIAVQPFYMDVMPPAGVHAYDLPPGKSQKSWEGSPAVPGRILGLGGHLHKYGLLLRFEDVTTGKMLWETKPVIDSTGEVVAMPRKYFIRRLGLQVRPDHVYRITAEYDNPTGKSIVEGAMGTLGGLFVPDDRAKWPQVDRSSPEYVADVKVTYTKPTGMMMH